MHKKVKARLINILLVGLILVGATGLILKSLNDNVAFYMTPSEVLEKGHKKNFRLGGYVKNESLEFLDTGLIKFTVTDFSNDIKVEYRGILPDIFREGQGVIVLGTYQEDKFVASKVLAKHDENYAPVKEHQKGD